jgi:hypothetical protein
VGGWGWVVWRIRHHDSLHLRIALLQVCLSPSHLGRFFATSVSSPSPYLPKSGLGFLDLRLGKSRKLVGA